MCAISADVLGLEKMSLQDWPRLERLRKAHFATNSEICLELARNTTEFFKKEKERADAAGQSGLLDSPELTAGNLYEFVMSRKEPFIADEEPAGRCHHHQAKRRGTLPAFPLAHHLAGAGDDQPAAEESVSHNEERLA